MLPVELWEPSGQSNSLQNIKRINQGKIIWFYYLIQNINVNMIFLQDKHNINAVYIEI